MNMKKSKKLDKGQKIGEDRNVHKQTVLQIKLVLE